MSETQQTTAERVYNIIDRNLRGMCEGEWPVPIADQIAAEIDALKAQLAAQDAALVDMPKLAALLATAERERDEARAEVERLRPAAEAWRTLEAARKEERTGTDENEHAEYWVHILARNAARAADRAREAKDIGGAYHWRVTIERGEVAR